MKLINKAAVVAQANIEISGCRLAAQQGILTEFGKGKLEGLEGIVDFIDTLEVKEVNSKDVFIEKACDAYCKVCGHYPRGKLTHICRQECDYFKDFQIYIKGK